jgi:hypothetical protein
MKPSRGCLVRFQSMQTLMFSQSEFFGFSLLTMCAERPAVLPVSAEIPGPFQAPEPDLKWPVKG